MSKTTVANITAKIKRESDYNITDTDLDTLIYGWINDILKLMKQWFLDRGIFYEVSNTSTFKTIAGQAYVDLLQAVIVGDSTTFTGTTDDKVTVTVDGTAYANINIGTCTTIALVVTAINTAVGSTVAYTDDNGYLMLKSPTSGATSSITIEDGATTAQTVVGDLFSVSAERTQSAITDVDEILLLTEITDDKQIFSKPYRDLIALYPSPTLATASVPDYFALWDSRIYFRPSPSAARLIYADYTIDITEISSSSTLPFKNKYDPVIVSFCRHKLISWLDESNSTAIKLAELELEKIKKDLIFNASRNIGQNRQPENRDDSYAFFKGPRMNV